MLKLNSKLISGRGFLGLLIFAIVFFFIYSYLPLKAPEKFNSPDETANFVFIKTLAKDDVPRIYEPLNREVDNLIHPRSINVSGDYLAPGSFLGLILIYGLIGKVLGLGVVSFLTPAVAVLAVLFFYQLIKKIFNDKIALLSSFFLLIQPAWWYWSSRTLANNVLFVSLVIGGLAILIVRKKKNELTFALGGLFFGLAVAVRTSEIVWLSFLLLTLAVICRKQLSWRKILIFLFFFVLVMLSIFYYSQLLYQNPFASGYSQLQENPPPRFWVSKAQIKHFFFPFEVVPDNFFKNFSNYFISLFSFYFVLFILGLLNFIFKFKRTSNAQKIYFVFFVIISLYLVVYYGSWNFHDNLDPNKVTIGTSYVRYWLPIYIFSLPFAALIFLTILDIFKKKRLRAFVGTVAALILFIYSANLVFFGEEGLLKVKDNLWDYQEKSEIIKQLTEENAVIVADRNDKTVFPAQRVVSCLIADCPKFQSLGKLIEHAPVYYYPSSPNFKVEEFNRKVLVKYGLEIDDGRVVKEKERIYKFRKLPIPNKD